MIETRLQGSALLDDVAATRCPYETIAFWWLGQNSFIYKGGQDVLYIDPYLSESPKRLVPPPLRPEEVTNAEVVLCTHDHSDHIDPGAVPGIAQASPEAEFVVPRTAVKRMQDLGVAPDRIIDLSHGEEKRVGAIEVTAIKTRHEYFDEDPELGFPYLGYFVRLNGVTFYHAGDANLYDDFTGMLWGLNPDVMFLPINGRDATRLKANCLGNMTYQEAVDLAGDVGPQLVVPMHYGMFEMNTEDPAKFTDYLAVKYPKLRAWVGAVGERVVFRKP